MVIEIIDNNEKNIPFYNSVKRESFINYLLHKNDFEKSIETEIIINDYDSIIKMKRSPVCIITKIYIIEKKLELKILNTYSGKILKGVLESGFEFKDFGLIDLNQKTIIWI
jgi:hypothetical protein